MKEQSEKPSFFIRLATWIVDKRNLFFLIYAAALLFSLFSSGWVQVNDDITSYLPEDSETRQGLQVMEEQFVTLGSARIMVSNITYEQGQQLAEQLAELEGVSSVDFGSDDDAESRSDHFRDSAALFSVTFAGESDDPVSLAAMEKIKDSLAGYDVSISSQVGQDDSEILAQEMNLIMGIAAIIILAVLLLTSKTYGEIPVLVMTFLAAMLLNMGTNFLLGEISFVSNSISAILQLALAIDYAIILCHRFSEEREHAPAREACILALSKAIPEISSSCLTTLAGLAAMMFMQFRLGFDMGLVLIKAIIFSILSVFTLMPGLLMLFSNLIDRSHHKSFVPSITIWGRFVTKLKYLVPPVFACVLIAVFSLSNQCPYAYGYTPIETVKKSEATLANEAINRRFGEENVLAVIVPAGDYEKEAQLLSVLESQKDVDYALGLANVEVKNGYTLTEPLTPRQFSELTGLDIEVGRLLYTAYAADTDHYGRILNDIDRYSVPLLDMFFFLYDSAQQGYVTLDDELRQDLDELYASASDAKKQLQGPDYSRFLLSLNLPEEGEETFAFLDSLHKIVGRYYPDGDFYITGNSTSDYDLATSFSHDNVLISVLTILFVIIVLLFTFQSVGLPILLIMVIQGSIWMNFAFPAIRHTPVFFLSYLIVSSIQMGANIDYAIVISSRYTELKKAMPPREAMIETLNQAFPTVLTSGTILAVAGTLIGQMTSDAAIYGVGVSLGRGTIISILLVMGVLPEILLLGDTVIEKTAFNLKYPALTQTVRASGKVHIDGRVRGTISGKIDAEVHGVVDGDVTALVAIQRPSPIQAVEKEENTDEKA